MKAFSLLFGLVLFLAPFVQGISDPQPQPNSAQSKAFSKALDFIQVSDAWRALLQDKIMCPTPLARFNNRTSVRVAGLTLSCSFEYDPNPPGHSRTRHNAINLTEYEWRVSINNFFNTKTRVVSLPHDAFSPSFSATLVDLEFIDNPGLVGNISDILSGILQNYPNIRRLNLTGNGFYGEIPDALRDSLDHLEKFTLSGMVP